MRLDKRFKIEKAASTDTTRHTITFVHLDEKAKALVATTGRILAKVPVELDGADKVESGSLTPDVIEAARKLSRRNAPVEIGLAESFTLKDGSTHKRPTAEDAGHYPNYQQIIPKDPAIKHRVTFNPKAFRDLCEAIGAEDSVTLEFQDVSGDPAIIVKSGEGYGLIMPMKGA